MFNSMIKIAVWVLGSLFLPFLVNLFTSIYFEDEDLKSQKLWTLLKNSVMNLDALFWYKTLTYALVICLVAVLLRTQRAKLVYNSLIDRVRYFKSFKVFITNHAFADSVLANADSTYSIAPYLATELTAASVPFNLQISSIDHFVCRKGRHKIKILFIAPSEDETQVPAERIQQFEIFATHDNYTHAAFFDWVASTSEFGWYEYRIVENGRINTSFWLNINLGQSLVQSPRRGNPVEWFEGLSADELRNYRVLFWFPMNNTLTTESHRRSKNPSLISRPLMRDLVDIGVLKEDIGLDTYSYEIDRGVYELLKERLKTTPSCDVHVLKDRTFIESFELLSFD